MNHESASYKRYKEGLSDKGYADYVLADGEINKLFSVNYPNTVGYYEFIDKYKSDIQNEIADIDSVVDIIKYIEFDQISKSIQQCSFNVELRSLALRHLRVSMKVNTNVSDDDISRVDKLLTGLKLFIHAGDILDYDTAIVPMSYGVRYTTLKHTESSLIKVGISKREIKELLDKEYENRILLDMVLIFRESNLKISQFYGTSYYMFKGLLFTYRFSYDIDIDEVHKFIDSFDNMWTIPTKYILYMYNGKRVDNTVYKGVTIAIRNVTECMDKYLIQGLSFTKSFKS